MAPIWVIPPLCSQVKVPPYTGFAAGGVVAVVVVVEEVDVVVFVVEEVEVVFVVVVVEEVDLLQLMANKPVKIIIVSTTSKIFFIVFNPPKTRTKRTRYPDLLSFYDDY
jgi:hypothetical protein